MSDKVCSMCGKKLGEHTINELAECQAKKNGS
jgi:hypothetical protein